MITKRFAGALVMSMAAMTMMAGTAAAEGYDEETPSFPVDCELTVSDARTEFEAPKGCDEGGPWTPLPCEPTKGEYLGDSEWTPESEICGDDEGEYPVEPIQVWTPTPVIDQGSSLTVKGKGLCVGVPAIFAVQDDADWSHRVFSSGQYVSDDGTSHYIFSAGELSGFYGTVTVYVKQSGECEGSATTSVSINKKAAPAPEADSKSTPVPDNGTSRPDGSGGLIPAATPAAAPAVPTAVLSGGTTAAAAPISPTVASAAAPAQSGTSLPVTGASTDMLQLALVAFATGLGLTAVSTSRRRTASARTR